MENPVRQRRLVGGLLVGSATLTLFGVVFFTLGPVVFAQAAPRPATESARYAQKFQEVLEFVTENYVDEVDRQKLFDGAMKGLFESLGDPYTLYLNQADMTALNDTTTGEFGGVGLYIDKLPPETAKTTGKERDQWVEVVAPIEDTPAFQAGLRAGDAIRTIDGEDAAPLTLDQVLSKLRGKPGTKVTIEVRRGQQTDLTFTLQRELIQVPTVKSAWIGDDVAYLRIVQFTAHTLEAFDQAIEAFEAKGFRRLVIDLRNNPGGLLEVVAKVGGRFFADGVVVSTRSRIEGQSQVFEATVGQTVADDVSIVVLIDKGSASASEILAGALKDRERAHLIGATTYGKGSVQQVIPFEKTGFKITMARYYTPSGVNIDRVGIAPHETIEWIEFDEAGQARYAELVDRDALSTWASAHLRATAAEVEAQAQAFLAEGTPAVTADNLAVLSRLLRLELDRANARTSPPYDLAYDRALARAVEYLRSAEKP